VVLDAVAAAAVELSWGIEAEGGQFSPTTSRHLRILNPASTRPTWSFVGRVGDRLGTITSIIFVFSDLISLRHPLWSPSQQAASPALPTVHLLPTAKVVPLPSCCIGALPSTIELIVSPDLLYARWSLCSPDISHP
jgi:hypothetical protein